MIDYAIIVAIAISGVIAVLRGFVHEALSLIAWVVAIWVGIGFMSPLAQWLEPHISIPLLRQSLAFFALVALVLLAASVVVKIAKAVIRKVELSATDRAIGLVFGCGRGALIITLLVLFMQHTPLSQERAWRESRLLPYFLLAAQQFKGIVPQEIQDSMRDLGLTALPRELQAVWPVSGRLS